jgi:hypothetical protein
LWMMKFCHVCVSGFVRPWRVGENGMMLMSSFAGCLQGDTAIYLILSITCNAISTNEQGSLERKLLHLSLLSAEELHDTTKSIGCPFLSFLVSACFCT